MKLFKYIAAFGFLIFFTSCEDYFGDDANVDPDNPTSATVNVLLPQVQARLAYTYGGDFARYLGINTGHVDGVGRQFAVIGNYGIVPADVNSAWSNVYSGGLGANRVMLDIANESGGSFHYEGIGLALEAFTIMMATDAWGSIPYSDAFKFGENGVYTPNFDTQEMIYQQIFEKIALARTKLSEDDGGNPPGGDDFFYGGNAAQWLKMLNVLEARANLHLSKINGDAYSRVLAALNAGGFESSDDDFDFQFGETANETAPWYQYILERDDCEVGTPYLNLLTANNDPRIATYGAMHTNDHPIWIRAQNLDLMSYTEQEFIRAEALMATGDKQGAFDAMVRGLTSSFVEAQLDITVDDPVAYIASRGIDANNVNMNNIMTQKYLALYTNPEVFNDWRRTGIPALTPVSGSEIPRRLPYPETESLANPNTPAPSTISIFDRVWWDI